MGAFEWVTFAVVWAITLLPGIAAVFRGWLPPWLRGRVPSPRLWGGGQIALSIGITIEMTNSHWRPNVSLAGTIAGLCMILCGVGILAKAQRPFRRAAG
jgi:hypothetical protein